MSHTIVLKARYSHPFPVEIVPTRLPHDSAALRIGYQLRNSVQRTEEYPFSNLPEAPKHTKQHIRDDRVAIIVQIFDRHVQQLNDVHQWRVRIRHAMPQEHYISPLSHHTTPSPHDVLGPFVSPCPASLAHTESESRMSGCTAACTVRYTHKRRKKNLPCFNSAKSPVNEHSGDTFNTVSPSGLSTRMSAIMGTLRNLVQIVKHKRTYH